MKKTSFATLVALAFVISAPVSADELTEIIQKDLISLGYDPGNIQGELSTETIVAISKFQAENGLEVTGEPTPQLAGVIKAQMKQGSAPGQSGNLPTQAAAPAQAQRDPAALEAAQKACLEDKVAAAQASNKKKRGFGSLVKAVANTATRFGGNDLAREVSKTSREVYDVNATAQDWDRAAKDLGVTTEDIEACQNPPL